MTFHKDIVIIYIINCIHNMAIAETELNHNKNILAKTV